MFFLFYFISYCAFNQLNRVFSNNKLEESYYDLSHIEIYKPSHYKNKYVGLEKGDVFKIL